MKMVFHSFLTSYGFQFFQPKFSIEVVSTDYCTEFVPLSLLEEEHQLTSYARKGFNNLEMIK